ncbi:putative cis-zeatin O-glucosyltransferase [Aegilops tauschii subsp. strangulata]|nr:putative cis-zeatin O-glucosyltransferase [Aegilops tauschii subsp. strangulata]
MEGKAKNPAASVAVVAVPFPAQGHLNQLLHLSLELASRGLDVHYAASPPHVRQARARVHGWDDDALRSIHFHDLGISTYVSPPPDPAADPPFPSHLMPMFEAFTAGARAPLAAVLRELSASRRRVVVVHDLMNAFASEEAAKLPNGEAFGFHCTAVSSIVGRMDAGHRLLRDNGLTHLPTRVSEEFADYASKRAMAGQSISNGAGIIVNTCRALEGEFVDVVAEQMATDGKKLFAIGPLNPLLEATASDQGKTQRHQCLNWLDQQPPSSVLYVSFGSSSSLREEQVAELAAALHGSKQRFI